MTTDTPTMATAHPGDHIDSMLPMPGTAEAPALAGTVIARLGDDHAPIVLLRSERTLRLWELRFDPADGHISSAALVADAHAVDPQHGPGIWQYAMSFARSAYWPGPGWIPAVAPRRILRDGHRPYTGRKLPPAWRSAANKLLALATTPK
jgi:hypothetical protein